MQTWSEEDRSICVWTCTIINSLDDKVPVSMMKQSSSISSTNMVQSLTTVEQGAHGEDEEVKKEVAQDKAFTMIQQFR